MRPGERRSISGSVAYSIAGGSDRVAIATALGPIIYFNARTKTEEGRIDFPASALAISDDGTILAAVERSSGTVRRIGR